MHLSDWMGGQRMAIFTVFFVAVVDDDDDDASDKDHNTEAGGSSLDVPTQSHKVGYNYV